MTFYVLDSDHLNLHQRGYEPLKTRLSTVSPERIAITVVSVEELVRGRLAQVRRATKPQERVRAYHWLSKTFHFLCGFTILKYDQQAEVHFQALRAQKIRIGTQDLKIAAIVLSQNATLVTRNQRDFERVPALKIEAWSVPR